MQPAVIIPERKTGWASECPEVKNYKLRSPSLAEDAL